MFDIQSTHANTKRGPQPYFEWATLLMPMLTLSMPLTCMSMPLLPTLLLTTAVRADAALDVALPSTADAVNCDVDACVTHTVSDRLADVVLTRNRNVANTEAPKDLRR